MIDANDWRLLAKLVVGAATLTLVLLWLAVVIGLVVRLFGWAAWGG